MTDLKHRRATTVTVTVSNPLTATNEELIHALNEAQPVPNTTDTYRVEYINSRKEDGRVCFGVSWEVQP